MTASTRFEPIRLLVAVVVLVTFAGLPPAAVAATEPTAPAAPAGTPDVRRVDICVYAATPSGAIAAVAAAREGRSVLLVEPSRWVGGILGAGIKPLEDCPNPAAVGGLTQRVLHFPPAPGPVRDGFAVMLKEANVPVLFEHRVAAVEKDGPRMVRVRLENARPDAQGCPTATALPGPGVTVEAKVFVDASYEGDLMARAGVRYAVGREPADRFGEKLAGVQPVTNFTPIDPYVRPGDPASGLLPLVEPDHGKPLGAGDDYEQAYNFRFYVTSDPAKRAPITPPDGYDPAQYELVGRYVQYLIAHDPKADLSGIFPGWLNQGEYNYQRKSLVTMAPLGVSRFYQDGDYATRARVWRQHIDYLRGLHRFMSTDPRVPPEARAKVAELGLDRTHHPDTAGWPHQLYVRVARRMAGAYVVTEADVLTKTKVDDAVGLAQYGVDIYPVRRIATRDPKTGQLGVATEGNMFVGSNAGAGPYGVPYRSITPRADECSNLLVPVCFSASFVGYASGRMEPWFMVLGESAGVAAAEAAGQGVAVQALDVPKLRAKLIGYGQIIDPAKAPMPPPKAKKAAGPR